MQRSASFELILESLPSDQGDLAKLKALLLLNLEYSVDEATEILNSIPVTIATSDTEESLQELAKQLTEIKAGCSLKKRIVNPSEDNEEIVLFEEDIDETQESQKLILIDESETLENLLNDFNEDEFVDNSINQTELPKDTIAPLENYNLSLDHLELETVDNETQTDNKSPIITLSEGSEETFLEPELNTESIVSDKTELYEHTSIQETVIENLKERESLSDIKNNKQLNDLSLKKREIAASKTTRFIEESGNTANIRKLAKNENVLVIFLSLIAISLGFLNLFYFLNLYENDHKASNITEVNQIPEVSKTIAAGPKLKERPKEVQLTLFDERGSVSLQISILSNKTILLDLNLKDFPKVNFDSRPSEIKSSYNQFWIESLRSTLIVDLPKKNLLEDVINLNSIGRIILKDPRVIRRLPARVNISIEQNQIQVKVVAEHFEDNRVFMLPEKDVEKLENLFEQLSE